MTDVFISYASEDRACAEKLAGALAALGWSVWWDRKIITGQAFDQAIEHALETARSVVVLWSRHSVASEWVKNEATVAAERGVLVPGMIETVKLPLEFRRKQTADLTDWQGVPPSWLQSALSGAGSCRFAGRPLRVRRGAWQTWPGRGHARARGLARASRRTGWRKRRGQVLYCNIPRRRRGLRP